MAAVSRPSPTEVLELPALPELLARSSSAANASSWTTPDVSAYLSHLTSLPLSTLESEPTTLSSSSAQLTNALTTLCHTSYPTFLSLHSTTSTLSSSLASLSSSLDALLAALPDLESSAQTFAHKTRVIQKDRRKANLVLEQHDKLYDVLSLPLLLDSCVRNHSYNEALLLSNHSAALSQRFPTNPLIQSVRSECDARIQAMLGQLLGMLQEQAKLPALFRAVNFLRKMEVLDEEELALAFLTGREVYLEAALKAVEMEKKSMEGDKNKDKEVHARYLKRYIDIWREGVYDVVTQYTTIFLDRASSTSSSTPTHLHALLATFTTYHLRELLTLLRGTLPLISDPSLLTSLLTQLTYCANSFARVGMDFKGLLSPIFVDAVRQGITLELEDAVRAFCHTLNPVAVTKKQGSKSVPKRPSQLLFGSSSGMPPAVDIATESLLSAPANVPPQILATFPPLALYTNAVLSALNGLRMLAPVELMSDILRVLEGTVAKGGSTLLKYVQAGAWKGDTKPEEVDKESEVARTTCKVYFQLLIPFVRRALVEGVYGIVFDKVHPESEELTTVIKDWEDFSNTGS